MRLVAAVLTIAFLSAPLLATDVAPAAPESKKEKRVCREKKPTGSRLIVRTCHTESEWTAIDKEEQEHADREVGRVSEMGRNNGTGFNPN